MAVNRYLIAFAIFLVLCPAVASPVIHMAGGTARFRSFLEALAPVKAYASPAELPVETAGADDVFFVLPDYGEGARTLPEFDFDRLVAVRDAMDRGAGFYFENYLTAEGGCDTRHAALTGLQTVGRPRHLFQEYVVREPDGRLMQARDAFYLPAFASAARTCASVSDCVGTHRVSVKGKWRHPVLTRGRTERVASAAMNLSCFDPLTWRPRTDWRDIFATLFARVAAVAPERVRQAFDATWPEPLAPANGTDAAAAVRRAVEWHFRSGVMRSPDGTRGVFEMIRSNDLGVRRSFRTDTALLTGALLTDAGGRYGRTDWVRAGRALVDFQFAQGAQEPGGFFRWYDESDDVYASDCSRDGLAMINLYKATGNPSDLASARRLGDALLRWLGTNDVCSGCFNLRNGYEGLDLSDNPVFYGEMVSFLLQLREERYTSAARRVVSRVMRKFPDVTPFGFSDNFTFSRCLLMLACAQFEGSRDWSPQLNHLLDFFIRLRHPCGAIAETPIRLIENAEAGVGMGDGSDAITDILYCDYVVYGAASVLVRLPDARRGGIDLAKARRLAEGLRDFFLRTQIVSDDPRFDGGWMRAYDMDLQTYYGLNRDMEWGSYSIMGGWVMGFVPAILMNEGRKESWYVR